MTWPFECPPKLSLGYRKIAINFASNCRNLILNKVLPVMFSPFNAILNNVLPVTSITEYSYDSPEQ
jgi:hypothetical protein